MNYKKAYLFLFNQLSTLIETLKVIQAEAEELVISSETEITWLPDLAPEDEPRIEFYTPDKPFILNKDDDS
jgi:hypothetical protein